MCTSSRAPNDAQLVCLWCTRTKIYPLYSCAWNWPSNLASEGCVFSLKFCSVHQPEKVRMVSPSSDMGTTHVTLVAAPCCQLSYTPYVFKHCDLLVLKIIILWEAVCITLYSQNPNTTFKIRFWVFPHGLRLWRANSDTLSVDEADGKYPLKHQEGGEGTPRKIANWEPWSSLHLLYSV